MLLIMHQASGETCERATERILSLSTHLPSLLQHTGGSQITLQMERMDPAPDCLERGILFLKLTL